jgi:hypothetical protein
MLQSAAAKLLESIVGNGEKSALKQAATEPTRPRIKKRSGESYRSSATHSR